MVDLTTTKFAAHRTMMPTQAASAARRSMTLARRDTPLVSGAPDMTTPA
jgi:hypothetical protein